MRTERVFTNLTCNQNCTYCTSRSASDDRAFIAPAAVRARISAAIRAGAEELVLTGGEPTLRRDLPSLVAHARAAGAKRVVLETNATAITDALAAALQTAGVDRARVNLTAIGDALDAITRDLPGDGPQSAGGFEASAAGLAALAHAGVEIEIAAVLIRSTLAAVTRVPAWLAGALGDARRIHDIVVAVPVEAPDPTELVTYEEAAAALTELAAAARRVGIAVRMSPDSGMPPCVFPPRTRPDHVFAMTAGATHRPDHARIEACSACRIADRCPGVSRAYLAKHPAPSAWPIKDDRGRRRLSLVSTVREQIARELVTFARYRGKSGAEVDEHVIRVNFHCNQVCEFCFVSTHLPPAGDEAVRDAILTAGAKGARIVLSGGEPALNPKLVEYVALAKAQPLVPEVELQTNAILLDDPALVDRLAAAGLDHAFVSLHGSTADISDRVTGAPGTFARTVVGLDNLAKSPIRTVLNFVLCGVNHRDLGPYVRMVAARWPGASVNVSFVAPSTDLVPRDAALIPRYSDVLPHLEIALVEAERLGVPMIGFESMCGIPLCLVPSALDRFLTMDSAPDDGGEFIKPPPCASCALGPRCFGIRRGYVELHGAEELRPVHLG